MKEVLESESRNQCGPLTAAASSYAVMCCTLLLAAQCEIVAAGNITTVAAGADVYSLDGP